MSLNPQDFKLKFEIKQVIFRNYDGFSHIRIKIIDSTDCYENLYGDNKDMLGKFPLVSEGDIVTAVCCFKNSKRFGKHLSIVEKVHIVVPRKNKDLAIFIKRKTKGIGQQTLEKMISEAGLNIISILEKKPDTLIGVAGLTEKKVAHMREMLVKEKTYENLFAFLQSENIPTIFADRIYEKFNVESLSILRRNPYHICAIKGIDFIYADKIAHKLGIKFDNNARIKSAVIDLIDHAAAKSGDLFLHREDILERLNKYLMSYGCFAAEDGEISPELINHAIDELIGKFKLVSYKREDKEAIYHKYLHDIEVAIVEDLHRFVTGVVANGKSKAEIDSFIKAIEAEKGLQFAKHQKDAIHMAMNNKISILTGGPGTGKTFTVNMIVKTLRHFNAAATFTLLAPTGKASNRMRELINMPAMTIHKGIGLGPRKDDKLELEKMIDTDYVIIDESSMIDAELFHQLLTHVEQHTNILIVGDYEQLPSVGPGLILRDLIQSGVIPCTRLEFIYRQAEQSTIASNAYKLLHGVVPGDNEGLVLKSKTKDFYFVETPTEESVRDKIIEQTFRLINNHGEKIEDICILSPMKMGTIGTYELNKYLQNRLNPAGPAKAEYMVTDMDLFRVGDKVIHTKNNADLGVNNGDTGVIEDIQFSSIYKTTVISVGYVGKDDPVEYRGENIEELSLAYAITVHKSQGSEYNTVIMPMMFSHEFMLSKNAVYTAWTRAKKRVICIGQSEIVNKISRSRKKITRNSYLAERLKERFNQESHQ